MTLKSGRADSANSMRTALSDLYLEHLLQNRPKAEATVLFFIYYFPALLIQSLSLLLLAYPYEQEDEVLLFPVSRPSGKAGMETLKIIHTAEFSPFIVFIAPTDKGNQSETLQLLQKDSEAIRSRYAHYFDLSLVNNGVEESLGQLQEAFERACTSPQWVPVSWVY
ncbi:hypothetical protein JRQ81_007172 [Phrynocephalus forsythii]|uniref:Guanylate kinase-like domain-containing protein n=1 Tax=Phrynocephalus forsythii TaxID=171643 RepID=A0A9Q0XDN0_9SAUR|nr:hypothetical protein JRQ81_007172 [Phrynocephalus forsythii]